jgi:hypothetical protein
MVTIWVFALRECSEGCTGIALSPTVQCNPCATVSAIF